MGHFPYKISRDSGIKEFVLASAWMDPNSSIAREVIRPTSLIKEFVSFFEGYIDTNSLITAGFGAGVHAPTGGLGRALSIMELWPGPSSQKGQTGGRNCKIDALRGGRGGEGGREEGQGERVRRMVRELRIRWRGWAAAAFGRLRW